jgi:signal transduction histidine kinase
MLVCHDVTQIGENLRLNEKIKSLNLMASYLSHEMLTPLMCIDQFVQKIKKSMETGSQNYKDLAIISQTIQFLLSNVKS